MNDREVRRWATGENHVGVTLPTARMYVDRGPDLVIQCQACCHKAHADYSAMITAGRGDVPLRELRFICSKCGNRKTTATVDGSRYGKRSKDA